MNTNKIPEQDIKLGKCVKLNEPYRPEKDALKHGKGSPTFQYGLIVEITRHKFDCQLRASVPCNAVLELFNPDENLDLCRSREKAPARTFVDFHVSEFLLCTDNMTQQDAQPFISQES